MDEYIYIPECHMCNLVGWIVYSAPQCLHQICSNWLDVLVQEIRLQIINTEF